MSAAPSTPDDANLSALGRELLDTGGSSSKPSGPWVPPTAEELGKLLPDYEIVKMLGRGGMGAVYMGRQKSLDRPVAIKILSTALEDADPSFAERFKNEARAMGKLNHPGIVAVHDFGEAAGGLLYIVMEFVEGTDVSKMIAKEGRLHTEHAMAITARVCDALAYAHERGIIHRDIKPANIMVGYDGVVKVADFGLAKMTQSPNTGLTQSGMAMGTLHYMAPEALMLGSAVDHRADIYAVGVMLYQMLTGKIPQGMFRLPSLQIAGLDPRYDAIIAKAIMEDREQRYQTVREMRGDLDAILTQPVAKVEAPAEQNVPVQPPPAALPTQARPQRPGAGQPYRPPQPTQKSSSGWLAWGVLGFVALGGGYAWMNLGNGSSGQTVEEQSINPAPANQTTPPASNKMADVTPAETAPMVAPVPPAEAVSKTSIQAALIDEGSPFRWELAFAKETYESRSNLPQPRSTPEDVNLIQADHNHGVLRWQFADSRLSRPGVKITGALLRFHTSDIPAAKTDSTVFVTLNESTIGSQAGALADTWHEMSLDADKIPRTTAAFDIVLQCGQDGVLVSNQKSKFPTRLILIGEEIRANSGGTSSSAFNIQQLPDFRTRVANYQKARHAQLNDLTTKYRAALTTEKATARKSGVLAAVTACDAATANATAFAQLIEANLTATGVKPLPALGAVADPAPPRLKELRDIFVREVAKIETTLITGLDSSLATVQASLVQTVKLTEAKVVEAYRQQMMAAFKTSPASSSASMAAPSPPADLPAQTRIIQRLVAIQNVCAWPNLTLMPDGSITAIVFNQPNHGTTPGDLDCHTSSDGLKWERRGAVTAHEPETTRLNHAAGLAGNGDLIVLCSGWTNVKQPQRPKQQPFRDAVLRSWVLRSKDGGRSWSKNDVFPAAESADWSEYVPFGDIWKTQDGTLRASCYHEHYVNPTQSIKSNGLRAWCFRSDDDGATWKPQALISPTHSETALFPLGGKSWLAAARDTQVDLIRSDDDCATWGQPTPATGRGEVNGHLTRLADKRLLLSYGVRSRGSQGVSAKLSSDEGRTWSPPIRLADSLDSDCGYPSSVQLANGRIVTAYYSKRSSDYNGYHMGVVVWEPGSASSASSMPAAMPAPPRPTPNAVSQTPATPLPQATKDKPFVNSLGMKFVPVKITGGPTDGKTLLFSVWETRNQDYAAFLKGWNRSWTPPNFLQGQDHPVVNVTWDDAVAFCDWLTQEERKSGRVPHDASYRLPTDHEWSNLVGLGAQESATMSPKDKHLGNRGIYPWGTTSEPPQGFANYRGTNLDPFKFTAPVGSFQANEHGLWDVAGNVEEWCQDWYDPVTKGPHVYRGRGWDAWGQFRTSAERGPLKGILLSGKTNAAGFRVVLELP